MSSEVHFHEEQRFTQSWFWAVILAMSLIPLLPLWYGVYQQLVLHIRWGNRPLSDDKLMFYALSTTGFALALLWGLRWMRLETTVHDDGLSVRFLPFVRRKVLWSDIASFKARIYNPLSEYGGWGLRWGRSGKALNVSGNRGVQLELRNGEKLLIGSQHAEELEQAIHQMRQKATPTAQAAS